MDSDPHRLVPARTWPHDSMSVHHQSASLFSLSLYLSLLLATSTATVYLSACQLSQSFCDCSPNCLCLVCLNLAYRIASLANVADNIRERESLLKLPLSSNARILQGADLNSTEHFVLSFCQPQQARSKVRERMS